MGLIARFPVRLPAKMPETGRSRRSGNGRMGPCTSPDGPFLPIRTYEVTHGQKKDLSFHPVGDSVDAHPYSSKGDIL